jgi:hypothetical protein
MPTAGARGHVCVRAARTGVHVHTLFFDHTRRICMSAHSAHEMCGRRTSFVHACMRATHTCYAGYTHNACTVCTPGTYRLTHTRLCVHAGPRWPAINRTRRVRSARVAHDRCVASARGWCTSCTLECLQHTHVTRITRVTHARCARLAHSA